jgi:hypothetical protein
VEKPQKTALSCKEDVMLIEFRVKNFRSFKEEQVFSMVASKDDSLSDNVVEVAGWRLLRTAAIYGANASGKSNLIKAIRTMSRVIGSSAQMDSDIRNDLVPFALDPENRDKPCRFEATFLLDGVRHQYGFSATRKRVHDEWLFSYPEGRARKLFEREYDPKSRKTEWDLESRNLTGQKKKIKDMVRDDALYLSIAAQLNHEQLTPIYHYFDKRLRSILTGDLMAQTTEKLMLRGEASDPVNQLIANYVRLADPTICDIRARKIDLSSIQIPDNLTEEMKKDFMALIEANPPIAVVVDHEIAGSDQHTEFQLEEESDGTRRLFQLLGPILETIRHGLVVFVDEIERSLHPLLAHRLIQDLQSPELNQMGAQIIMTTHDTTLLDPELFRRDQIWFTEKDGYGATHLYSMADYKEKEKGKVRKDEAYQKRYLEGRYGAIPIIQRFELNEPTAS